MTSCSSTAESLTESSMSPFVCNLPDNQLPSMDEICGPGACVAAHGFRAATPRPTKPKVARVLWDLRESTLGVQNVRDVDSKPSRDFQRPPISLDGFVFFEYIVQRFSSRIYQVSRCGLSHASTKLIGHVFQPQFAAHSELDQEHFSSNNAGPCKLIRCTRKLELDPVPRKHTINKLEEPP